jgi:hypothetical protein
VSDDGMVSGSAAGGRSLIRPDVGFWLLAAAVWLAGSTAVAAAQPGTNRKEAAVAAAAAGILMIVLVDRLTEDPARRYFRSLLGGVVAASLTADATLRLLAKNGVIRAYFGTNGVEERITLPLIVVLLAPLVLRALWARRSDLPLLRRPVPMDVLIAFYATAVAVPALAIGVARHHHLSFVGQDLGLLVFFVFTYLAGRLVGATAARASAREFVDVLLIVAVGQLVLFGWQASPLYSYVEAACAAAVAFALLQPRRTGLLPLGVAVTILATDGVAIHDGTNSATTIELLGAVAVIGYLVVRLRPLVPRWLVVGAAAAALAVFLGFTGDGRTIRGQYNGPDPSNIGRTYEARQVRAAVGKSPLWLVFGRGFGATINEVNAPPAFRKSLLSAGRNLHHVQEIHLLPYSFLLKEGFLGLFWLLAFALGLLWLLLRALERAVRERDPTLVLYAALPGLALAQAIALASRLQSDPLVGLTLGMLVACVAARPRRETS